jgi:uncharacterized protein with PIN domain
MSTASFRFHGELERFLSARVPRLRRRPRVCASGDAQTGKRVYWEGSHWDRMRNVLATALAVPVSDMR